MIKIICLGKIKDQSVKEIEQDYLKRISKYQKISIIELEDEKDDNPLYALKKEAISIKKYLKPGSNIIILDINGKEYNSIELSNFIDKELTRNSNLTFIIGSSNGLDESIKELSSNKISFSKLTFPHQLFRVIFLEQIYRSFKILNNETYHK